MRIARSLAAVMMVLPCVGCGLMPHSFRKLQPPEGLTRARTVGEAPHHQGVAGAATLVARLDDEDPVVRMAAIDELRRTTGQDLGFVPWAGDEERAAAVARWRGWLKDHPAATVTVSAPRLSPRAARQASRRRRRRSHASANQTRIPNPPMPEGVAS